MIINPYDTVCGKVVYNKNDIDKVIEYVKKCGDQLTYEFYNTADYSTYMPAFITGKDSIEQSLPYFNQLIVYENNFDNGWVVSDLRKCISKNILRSGITNIYNSGFITNRAGLDFEVIKTLIGCELADSGNLTSFKKSFNTIAMAYAVLIGNLLRIKLNYGVPELLAVRMACFYYVMMMFSTTTDIEGYRKQTIERMLHVNYGLVNLDARTKKNYLDNLTATGNTINDLVSSINSMFNFMSYPVTLNSGILLQTVSEYFKGGPNGSENIMVALEYMPNFIALIYSSFTEKSYRNTGLTKLLDNFKKIIQPEPLVNDIKYLISEYKAN